MPDEQVHLILKHEPVRRLLGLNSAARPNVAVVYSDRMGALTTDGPRWRQSILSRYGYRYEVDLSAHYHTLGSLLPARDEPDLFEATINVGFRVADPAEIVRRNVDDALRLVAIFLTDALRPITRKYNIQELGLAEDSINARFHQPMIMSEGIEIFRCRVQLTPDPRIQEHFRQRREIQLSDQLLVDKHRQLMSHQNLFVSGTDLLQLHLLTNPQDTEAAFRILQQLPQGHASRNQSLIDLLGLLLEHDLVESRDIDTLRQQIMSNISGLTLASNTEAPVSLTIEAVRSQRDPKPIQSMTTEAGALSGGVAELIIQNDATVKRISAFRVGRRLLITAYHVIGKTEGPIKVVFAGDSVEHSGSVLYSDPATDLAIVEADLGYTQGEFSTSRIPDTLAKLATAFAGRYKQSGHDDDLSGSIRLYYEALGLTEQDPPYPPLLSNLATALRMRFERTGEAADLDEAVTLLRRALDTASADEPEMPVMLSNLATALRMRFGRTGEAADLDEAVTLLRRALDTASADQPEMPVMLSNLATALQTRFGRTGEAADLDEAVTLLRRALDTASADQPEMPVMLSNLATALQTRFGRTGEAADLDEAVTLLRRALDTASADQPEMPVMLSNLATALQTRFGRTGEAADLDEAVTLLRRALDTTPSDHPRRARFESLLARASAQRAQAGVT